MTIVEITTPEHIKEFLTLPVKLYKNDPLWIRPLDNDIEKVFDKKKNKFFRHGVCTRWLLKNDKGETVGRTAAFIDNDTKNKDNDQPTGGMGFFECINDRAAAFLLFDTCKAWLKEKGIEAMDGPINFGERDEWWGCLADGFYEPVYTMNYNPPYYNELFEAYGFQVYFKQYTYRRVFAEPADPKLFEKAERIFKNPDYSFSHFEMRKQEKYTEDFRTIYNNAWGKHTGTKPMSTLQAKTIMKQMKPVLDEKIIWFAYYKGEPVAFYVQILDANQAIKHMNGKMNLWGMLTFAYYKFASKFTRIIGVAFGVVPAHQRKGVEAAIVIAFSKVAQVPNYKYKGMEMKWIGDFNPNMMRVAESVGGSIYKTHITYRKLFDETKEFKRCPMIA